MSVAVVTGAARGFGLEIARRLLARGHDVLLADLDAAEAGAAAAGLGPRAHAIAADVRDPDAHRTIAARAAALGPVQVWVNNAGVSRPGKAWEHSDAEVRQLVEVNLLGVVSGSRAAVEVMRERGGRLLNIASMAALGPVPGLALYAATKAGVLSFSTGLQGDLELAGVPIRVYVLCPDAADTRMVRDHERDPDAAVLFSGGALLDPRRVADEAVALLDGRRMVHALPAHRAGLIRLSAMVPTVGLKILKALRAVGTRRQAALPSR